jgi:hypothetical protein
MGLNVFNSLPSYIKVKINDINEFKWLIKNFLYCNTFYTLEEYFNYFNRNKNDNTIWMFLWAYVLPVMFA